MEDRSNALSLNRTARLVARGTDMKMRELEAGLAWEHLRLGPRLLPGDCIGPILVWKEFVHEVKQMLRVVRHQIPTWFGRNEHGKYVCWQGVFIT